MHIGKSKHDRKESWHIQSMGQTAYMSTGKYTTIRKWKYLEQYS